MLRTQRCRVVGPLTHFSLHAQAFYFKSVWFLSGIVDLKFVFLSSASRVVLWLACIYPGEHQRAFKDLGN